MSGKTKTGLILAAVLLLLGCAVIAGTMMQLQWDFSKLSTVRYEVSEYALSQIDRNVSIVTDTADVAFVPSQDGKCTVVCYEPDNAKHRVTVTDGSLSVEVVDAKKWYDYVGSEFETPKITVRIPQGAYATLSINTDTGDIEIPQGFRFDSMNISGSTCDVTNCAEVTQGMRIKTSTGEICVENTSCEELELAVSTGKTKLSDVNCKNLISTGDTGDISMENVIVKETVHIERSTGDVELDRCDGAEIFISTSTGDVEGSLLSDKVFLAQTSTGDMDVPDTTTGGRCEIITDTGDISIKIHP